jgi:hypothetical protein
MSKALDLKDKRFGRLVALCRANVPNARNAMWQCQCDCGATTIVAAANLGTSTSSCGCIASENGTTMLRVNRLARTDLHGESGSVEWAIWSRMKNRCNNPNNAKYHRYGGRGIKVCDRWLNSFENFLSDVGRRPSKKYSIDRINNDGDYEPDNVKWSTAMQQSRNSTAIHPVEIDGISMCIKDWCKTLGVPMSRPWTMIRNRGSKRDKPPAYATIEDALTALYHAKS